MSDLPHSPPLRASEHEDADRAVLHCVVSQSGSQAAWVRLRGELDLATVPVLHRALGAAQDDARLVILDLRGLTFLDSSGLHAILGADARARSAGQRLVLVRGPAQVHRLLELVGLADHLEVVDLTADVPMVSTPRDAAPEG